MVVVLHFSCNRCRSFAPSNARVSSSVLWRGISRVPAIGCRVLHWRPIRHCAGLVPIPCDGVLRQSSKARYLE